MIENWIKVFDLIINNSILKQFVTLIKISARTMNGDSTLSVFDISDILRVFDLKSTEDSSKPIYHYLLKAIIKMNSQHLDNLS